MSFETFLNKILDRLEKINSNSENSVEIEVSGPLEFTIDKLKAEFTPILNKTLETYKRENILQEISKNGEVEHIYPPIFKENYTPIEEVIFRRNNNLKEGTVKIGGEIAPPYINFLTEENNPTSIANSSPNPNKPRVTYDVFDMKISLPKMIKNHYKEVLNDPAGWAELAVKYGADMVTLHFISTDPGIIDAPVSESAKILEEVLQRINVPVIIGGSGNKKKDTELFTELAAISEGEQLMLSSADKVTWDKVVPLARDFGHNVLLWAQLDINDQMKLVEDALSMGMPRNRIVLDATCASLGYGFEYSFSIYQKIRLAGLNGDTSLNFPLSGGTTNAWGARESWMKELGHITNNGGARELRGPLWEALTATTMSLAGLDLAMMLHPFSAQLFKEIVDDFYSELPKIKQPDYENWVSKQY